MAESPEKDILKITEAECKTHQFPPVNITLDITGLGFEEFKFDEPSIYLELSGPPGGPSGLRIESYGDMAQEEDALKQWVLDRYAEEEAFTLGHASFVPLSHDRRLSLTYSEGSDLARAHHCVILFPSAPDSKQGLLLEFWMQAGDTPTPNTAFILEMANYSAMFKSLDIEFGKAFPVKD